MTPAKLMLTALLSATLPAMAAQIDASGLKASAKEGDKVSLQNDGGILSGKYDVGIKSATLSGHVDQKQSSFDLLLPSPLPLDESVARIVFEAEGISAKSFQLCPLLRDAKGELLWYIPDDVQHFKSGSAKWSKWMSNCFYAGEAGGASFGVFRAEGGDGNSWPDGKLELLGFRAIVKADEFGRKTGEFSLGSVETGGLRLVPETPFVYADALLSAKGSYTFLAEVFNEFQGPAVREIKRRVDFDPASAQSRHQRIELPLGPVDTYWVKYQALDEAGAIAASGQLCTELFASSESQPLSPLDPSREPLTGVLSLSAGDKGVFSEGEPFAAKAKVFAKGRKALKISWSQTQYAFDSEISAGSAELDFSKSPSAELPIKLERVEGRDAYRLKVEVSEGGKAIDSKELIVGIKSSLGQEHARKGYLRSRDEFKSTAYFRTSYLPPDKWANNAEPLKTEAEAAEHFRRFLTQSSQMSDGFTYMVELVKFQVLPGVYDFSLLDKAMDSAADCGTGMTIRFCFRGKAFPECWPKYNHQRSYNGSEIRNYYGSFSVTDPVMLKVWHDAYRAFYERYKGHPAFHGYYIMEPAGEWTVADMPWEGTVADYSSSAVESFRSYLRDELKFSLESLNKRWGSSFKSWAEVEAPMPDFKRGALPDLRLQWLDFCRYKAWLDKYVWFADAVKTIRSFDKDHLIIAYTIMIDDIDFVKPLYGQLDYLHNGGNQGNLRRNMLFDAWYKGRVGWITEPHYPHHWSMSAWVLDQSVWDGLRQAGGGGTNLHIYYHPNPMLLQAHYGGLFAYDRFEKYRPILREMVYFKPLLPEVQAAAVMDPATLFCKHRTAFEARRADLERDLDLLEGDSVPYEVYDKAHAGKYKLLVPNMLDQVLSLESVEAIAKGVEGGAKAVITANTGKYVPELGQEPFQLLKRFGIKPPEGAYVQLQSGLSAKAVRASALLDEGSSLKFFSLADYRNDLRDPAVKGKFFSYCYRWIPETDYFGAYLENRDSDGEVLARFPNGSPALSVHKFGKGEVAVFWGTPSIKDPDLNGFMGKALAWAGGKPWSQRPYLNVLEGKSDELKRHYAIFFAEKEGSYAQPLLTVPDGSWYLDELVCDRKLGIFTGKELREQGLKLEFPKGESPLKIVRMMKADANSKSKSWQGSFRAD